MTAGTPKTRTGRAGKKVFAAKKKCGIMPQRSLDRRTQADPDEPLSVLDGRRALAAWSGYVRQNAGEAGPVAAIQRHGDQHLCAKRPCSDDPRHRSAARPSRQALLTGREQADRLTYFNLICLICAC